jgi:MFS family permease
VGRKPVFRAGTWAALALAFPVAALVQSEGRLAIFVALVAGLGLVYGVVYGPLAAFWSELFDTRYRYTALSSLYQISGVVASGLTPLIAAWLVSLGNGTLWWVAAYNVAVAAISLISARLLPETRGRDLDHAWRVAPSAEAEPREPLAA